MDLIKPSGWKTLENTRRSDGSHLTGNQLAQALNVRVIDLPDE